MSFKVFGSILTALFLFACSSAKHVDRHMAVSQQSHDLSTEGGTCLLAIVTNAILPDDRIIAEQYIYRAYAKGQVAILVTDLNDEPLALVVWHESAKPATLEVNFPRDHEKGTARLEQADQRRRMFERVPSWPAAMPCEKFDRRLVDEQYHLYEGVAKKLTSALERSSSVFFIHNFERVSSFILKIET